MLRTIPSEYMGKRCNKRNASFTTCNNIMNECDSMAPEASKLLASIPSWVVYGKGTCIF